MNIAVDAIVAIIVEGALLGGVIGIVMGAIAWLFTERGSGSLGLMAIGAAVGLLLGFYFEGLPLIRALGLDTISFLYSSGNVQDSALLSLLDILKWMLGGAALFGAISSFGRAITGAIAGGVAGTLAGILLLVVNNQFSLGMFGNVLTLLTAIVTMVMVIIISVSAAE